MRYNPLYHDYRLTSTSRTSLTSRSREHDEKNNRERNKIQRERERERDEADNVSKDLTEVRKLLPPGDNKTVTIFADGASEGNVIREE